jgi:2-methylcitrate dehydratase PrpD
VRCVPDAQSTEVFPQQFPAVLTIRLADGSEIVERITSNRGGLDRPLSRDELALKFRLNASHTLDSNRVGRLESAILMLDTAESVDGVMELTSEDEET